MAYGVVYCIRHKDTGKEYIGQTRQPVMQRVWHNFTHRTKAPIAIDLKTYGMKAFEVSVLEECDTAEGLEEAEIRWIKERNTFAPNGYNLTTGGLKPRQWHPDVNATRGDATRGRKRPAEECERISRALKGRQITWGDKISESRKRSNWRMSPEQKAAFVAAGRKGLMRPEVLAKRKGEGNGRAVLTWEKVEEIRIRYAQGGISQQELADEYGVKQVAISRVVLGTSWAKSPSDEPPPEE